MTFCLRQGKINMSSHITHTRSSNIHPIAHILDTCALILGSCALFSLSQLHHVMASHPSPGDSHQNTRGKNSRVKLNQLHMHQGSQLFPVFHALLRSLNSYYSVAQGHFTPSIQPNLRLPHTHPPITPAINTLLAIQYSSIFSTCPNHLNTL